MNFFLINWHIIFIFRIYFFVLIVGIPHLLSACNILFLCVSNRIFKCVFRLQCEWKTHTELFCNAFRTSTKRVWIWDPCAPRWIHTGKLTAVSCNYNNLLPFIWNELFIIKIMFAFMHSINVNCYLSLDIIGPLFCCWKYATDIYWLLIYCHYHSAACCFLFKVS